MKLDWSRASVFSLAALMILAMGARVSAQSAFDGGWSVLIITEAGTCDAAYKYPLQIVNGTVLYDASMGAGLVQISGKVELNGQVKVIVQRGDRQAVGAGQLSRTTGSGTWLGESAIDGCSGRWEAKRN